MSSSQRVQVPTISSSVKQASPQTQSQQQQQVTTNYPANANLKSDGSLGFKPYHGEGINHGDRGNDSPELNFTRAQRKRRMYLIAIVVLVIASLLIIAAIVAIIMTFLGRPPPILPFFPFFLFVLTDILVILQFFKLINQIGRHLNK